MAVEPSLPTSLVKGGQFHDSSYVCSVECWSLIGRLAPRLRDVVPVGELLRFVVDARLDRHTDNLGHRPVRYDSRPGRGRHTIEVSVRRKRLCIECLAFLSLDSAELDQQGPARFRRKLTCLGVRLVPSEARSFNSTQ